MNALNDILIEMGEKANAGIIDEFSKQGHELTGEWGESLIYGVTGDEVIGVARTYGAIVDTGVSPDRIPYNPGTRTGNKESKYISGLANFWKLRKPGISDKEALSLAFATAAVQKREGMSTIASREFSQTQRRQQFVNDAFEIMNTELESIFNIGTDSVVEDLVPEQKELIL